MSAPLIALKVDVDTLRGTLEGVPRLLELFRQKQTDATFLFSLGPDHTGWAIRRVFRRGFLGKVKRTSVIEHYGLKTLLYGTLLPSPDIGRRAGDIMRQVRDAGFETGIHCWDHVLWQDQVARADAKWTDQQMRKAADRYAEIFGEPAIVHGAAGWQMNDHALRMTGELGFHWCSDARGTHPFLPAIDGEALHVPQLPTTLPTLDELIGIDGITTENVADRMLELTKIPPATGHVFTLHAELEGMKFLPILDRLLTGWRSQDYDLGGLRTLAKTMDFNTLPRHEVINGTVPGRSGKLLVQGGVIPL
ncbi:MAG: 4-deoxy-4-formamido-L-arabinose-phosphoundecaprenol deformylase [Candidatus Contendobacter sp.]|jgi:undecaprenyl phosphate-alpha-L-ara4FN deformylase|nr:4-deoxy-4-formamido-L-arabinose-phosphoundecaprenol deformylase [Gammaproteobacteria bacterium]MCC8992409.1 4-deoxy-4-formamido-L-arabinose-phosphoundecaprenol deformylase [Candidatus Contendobacter sp.]